MSRLLKTPPPAWEKLYRRHGITSAPSPEQMVLKLLESTPSGASAGGRGKRVPAPPPDVRKAALEGLRLSHAHNYTSESGIGLARAVQLAAGLPVWERSIERMKSYFARHAVDRKGPGFGDARSPSRGYMAWLNWGGDSGMMWASRELALENGAPGYQSWQWRQQDWRAVILKGTKIDYSKKCGGKGTKLPNGRPRLCLPLYVLATLGKTKEGRRIIREQARKKEKAKRGQRVPWHPEIKRLHNKLEESIPEDDPRARRNSSKRELRAEKVRLEELDPLMGEVSDRELGEAFGFTEGQIREGRRRRGIESHQERERRTSPISGSTWTAAEVALLGTMKDSAVAERTGRHPVTVQRWRKELGIPPFKPAIPPGAHDWTEEIIADLGTATDREIGEKYGISNVTISVKRKKLGIPSFQTQRREQREKEKRERQKRLRGAQTLEAAQAEEILRQQAFRHLQGGSVVHHRDPEMGKGGPSYRSRHKQRKNPSFKVGDRVMEGKRSGKVHAIHSKGTVDVLFDDMEFPIRRQTSQVRRTNPKDHRIRLGAAKDPLWDEWKQWARAELRRKKPVPPSGLLGGRNPVVLSEKKRIGVRPERLLAGGSYWNPAREEPLPSFGVDASWGVGGGFDALGWPPKFALWKKAREKGVELRPRPRFRLRLEGSLQADSAWSQHGSTGMGGHGFRLARTKK